MNRHWFKLEKIAVYQFAFRLKEMNRLIDYMPGKEAKLSEDKESLEVLWFTMPPCYKAIAAQARFDYSQETLISILSYFSRLKIFESIVDIAKGMGEGKQPNKNPNKLKVTKKLDTTKVTCGFLKNGQAESVCWKKKRAEMPNKKLIATAKVKIFEVPKDLDAAVDFVIAESFDDLIGKLLIENRSNLISQK